MKRKHRPSGLGRLRLLGLLLPVVALVAGAGPAAAAETIQGTGAGVGYSTINVIGTPGPMLCLHVSSGASYVVDVAAGSVTAAETTPTNNAAEYVGPLTVTITLSSGFYFNPVGTFTNSTCSGLPAAISASIAVTGSFEGGSVNCPADSGEFRRVNSTITFDELGSDGDGSCTVTTAMGLTSVTVSPVTHAFVGNEYPCLDVPMTTENTCPSPVDTVHVQGVWTVTAANT